MAKTKTYGHYCPIARSLEVIGEKWSLLIVRDLLRGPQRFSDLHRYLGGITPKWLTQRLRALEAAGIVERDSKAGRREVWYRLTTKGRALQPVVAALAVWGIENAMRPREPGEPVHPEQSVHGIALYFNERNVALPAPALWVLQLTDGRSFALRFDGERWSAEADATQTPDVRIEATPEAWVAFVTQVPAGRPREAHGLHIEGDPARVGEFLSLFGVERSAARTAAPSAPARP